MPIFYVFIMFPRKDQKKGETFQKLDPKRGEGVFGPIFCGPVDFWADFLPDALLFDPLNFSLGHGTKGARKIRQKL